MTEIISIILPIFIVFAFGFFLKKKFDTDISTLSNVSFYCLLPALVFKTFYTSSINGEIGWLVLFALVLFFVTVLLSYLLAKGFRLGKGTETGLILGSSFSNAGNYGSAIVLLAYGQAGFEWAITFWVIQLILMNTFGYFFAAQGEIGFMKTLKTVATMPSLYAGGARSDHKR